MATGKMTLLQINDVHGYLEPHPEVFVEGDHRHIETLDGYARISAFFQQIREASPGAVLALDNGDTFHGTYPVVKSKGSILLPVLNRLGLDAMTRLAGDRHATRVDHAVTTLSRHRRTGRDPDQQSRG